MISISLENLDDAFNILRFTYRELDAVIILDVPVNEWELQNEAFCEHIINRVYRRLREHCDYDELTFSFWEWWGDRYDPKVKRDWCEVGF